MKKSEKNFEKVIDIKDEGCYTQFRCRRGEKIKQRGSK